LGNDEHTIKVAVPQLFGMRNKQQELLDLYDVLKKLTDPSLSDLSTNLVPGEGNIDSQVVFVGEAPGRDEDKQGRPFVGSAGRLLNEALEKAGLKRSDVYITNVVKRRPPRNRPPRKAEIALFLPYLLHELEIIRPRLVCLLGATAIRAVLNKPLSEVQGRIVQSGGWCFFCTYHPAAIIYDPGVEKIFFGDIAKVRSLIDSGSK